MSCRILFVSLATMGGCQRVTVNYAKILMSAGCSCDILLWVDSVDDNNVLEQFIPSEIPYEYLNCRLRELPFKLYKYIRRKGGYDCVFSSWTPFNMALCITRLIPFSRIEHLVIRDDNMPSRHPQILQRALAIVGGKADAFIAQTEEMQNEFSTIYHLNKNSFVIHNPLDKQLIEASLSASENNLVRLEGTPIYIASGRINPQKDYITLVKALQKVREIQTNANLYILGAKDSDGIYYQEVYNLIIKLNLENSIHFLGFQNNPYQYINKADVFVLSSIYEGLPNVMLEAIYLGKPIAATTCIPYISQVIKKRENGYTARTENPESLAHAMIESSKIQQCTYGVDVNHSEELIIRTFESICFKR